MTRFPARLVLWTVIAAAAVPAAWAQPHNHQMPSTMPAPGMEAMSPPPAPAPEADFPPVENPDEAFVPPPAMSGPAQFPDLEIDDPVGRRFVELPPLPEPPPGLEIIGDPEANPAFTGAPLTLEEALALASQNNPTLLQAQELIQGTLGLAIEAGLWPNPVFIYVADQIFVQSDEHQNTPGEFQGAVIQQEIITADKRDISRAKYLQRTEAVEWLAVAQQWRVCNDVRIHFWRALGRRQIIGIRRELLKSAEDTVVTTRERWNLGQATRADVHMANVALQEARLDLLMAENDYLQAYEMLVSFIGVPLEGRSPVGELDVESAPIEFQAALADYYAEAPQLLRARTHLREEQITLKRELVEPIPNVFVEAGSGYNFESREPVASANVFFEVPIFDRNQGNIRRAEADLVRQRAEVKRTKLNLRQDLAHVYRDYLTAIQHVEQYREVILPEARRAYRNQLKAYKADRQNWGDVLMTQKKYFGLQLEYIQYLIAQRTNETLINGYLLHGGLTAPSALPTGHLDVTPQPR